MLIADTDKKEYPSFYAIIPAYVRYNKALSPNAKLLFGEITALADKKGYCYASNKYFSNVFGVDKSSVSHWVQQLIKTGCIKQEFIYADDKPIISERRIYITIPILPSPNNTNKDGSFKIEEGCEFSQQVGEILDPDNTNSVDGMYNTQQEMNIYALESENSEGGGEIIHQGGEKTHHGVVKNFNGGGEKTPEIILQANITRAAAADQILDIPEKPPPEEAATAPPDVSSETVDRLILHFHCLDRSLAFDEVFYPKVLSFLSEHGLGFDYVSWMYDLCSRKNPNSLSGYLFKTLLEPRYVEIYREASRPPPVVTVNCPVCGKGFSSADVSCPECGFEKIHFLDMENVRRAKALRSLAPDKKKAYFDEVENLSAISGMEFSERIDRINAIKQKYGLL